MRIESDRPYYADELGLIDVDCVIRGVYVGGCVETRNTRVTFKTEWAHAHNYADDLWKGWICIYLPEHVLDAQGNMTGYLAHEIAHLLCPNQDHSAKWKRTITHMGYASEIARSGLKPLVR